MATTSAENVGEILVRVQDDLHRLKEQLANAGASKGKQAIDLKSLEQAIERTEEGLRQNADKVMHSIQNRVQILPALNSSVKNVPDFEPNDSYQQYAEYYSMSPGEQVKELHKRRTMVKPDTNNARQLLENEFDLPKQANTIQKESHKLTGRVSVGSNVKSLTKLPARNRRDPQLTPPQIKEEDARKGILSLLERGLIPAAAQLTLQPDPVKSKSAPLHHISEQYSMSSKYLSGHIDIGFNMAGVKLDSSKQTQNELTAVATAQSIDRESLLKHGERDEARTSTLRSKQYELPTSLSKSLSKKPPTGPPPSSPTTARTLRFVISGGKEFKAFKKTYILNWGNLDQLATDTELQERITKDMLLDCVENIADVMKLISIPGRRFKGADGSNIAAIKIQAYWRRHKDRKVYLALRRQKWAAGIIAMSWLMSLKLSVIRKQLKQRRLEELEKFRDLSNDLKNNWKKIKGSSHVVIHIPSLGYSENIRENLHDIPLLQNLQMARLCEITDPNVDIILISPMTLSDETVDYYKKLLAVSMPNSDKKSINDRIKIIMPDALTQFKRHNMCLSTRLKYSPKAMKRLKNLTYGRSGYIVPGLISKDDLHIADQLDLPILGTEPDIAQLFSTKSGSRRIFLDTNVAIPPSTCDIFTFQEFYDELTDLIINHVNIRRWLFKIDNEFDGRGTAYCEIAQYLKCYKWLRKEAHRYGAEWQQKWAQESARTKILGELPDILDNYCHIVNKRGYQTWERFCNVYLERGGVIQACPPSDSVTGVTVDALVDPTGQVNIMSLGDQIHAESQYRMWGLSVPQSSVDPNLICETIQKIGKSCYSRGIIGHICIDFVTFIDGITMEQELWATDLKIWYSDTMAMSRLMRFMTNGSLDPLQSTFKISVPKKEEKKWRKKRNEPPAPLEEERFGVVSTKLFHSNMQIVHYGVFFQMCKAQGIGFDIKEKSGTVFTIADDVKRKHMGMLSISDSLQGALTSFAKALSTIHQEISSPEMNGVTNFKAAIDDIESILGITIENESEHTNSEKDT
ncbi:uncharacterized protein TRIADDRAFT_63760 [Trichoplax adhaerens]|uniref:IQCH-like ATP-grasp domain-containing protein n=1 Tax=Trichoplax adhaerens TaxID=10228 RepID=B3RSA9_TRIAD|nr:hypothetical protein TRIADDRAFT_63760 [Trichoplax adhaerens]EDV26484.1 hypothetical protein TRIADDRAFT_63760 [Trichoplax adhaerens]|eukprot:XP_002110480.1 hypothetical protein TRIADDRAFT_63760 [Trichoplax adhaerens]